MNKRLMIALAVLISPALVHASPDPFVGKWSLDARSSIYPSGTCPKSMTIEMRQVDSGVWYQSKTTYRNGAVIDAECTASYDGKQAIVRTGGGFFLPVSLTRIDARTVKASYSRGFQVEATSRRVVSPDGKTMRITTISKDAAGRRVKTVGFYKRTQQQAGLTGSDSAHASTWTEPFHLRSSKLLYNRLLSKVPTS